MRILYAGLFVSVDGVAESPNLFVGPYFDAAVGAEVGAKALTTGVLSLTYAVDHDAAAAQ